MRARTAILSQALVEAEQRGVDVGPAIAAVGLTRAAIDDWRVLLPQAPCHALIGRLLELTADPFLLLYAADRVPFGAFDVIDHLGGQCETVGAIWVMLARYFAIVNPRIYPRVQAHPEGWSVDVQGHTMNGGEVFLAATLGRIRILRKARLEPLRVELSRQRSAEAITRTIFGPNVHFNQPRTTVILSEAQFEAPMPSPDRGLRSVLEAHARLLVRAVEQPRTLAEAVVHELEGQLGQDDLSLKRIAQRLGMSARTLQRRLKAEDADFRALRSQTRRTAAERHLTEGLLSIEEIAFVLSYSDATAFQRAFKGWTGQTVGQWRRAQGRAAG